MLVHVSLPLDAGRTIKHGNDGDIMALTIPHKSQINLPLSPPLVIIATSGYYRHIWPLSP